MWARIVLGIVAVAVTMWLAFVVTFHLRSAHLATVFPNDGQIGLDAMLWAAAVSVASGFLMAGAIVIAMRARR